MIKDDGPYFPPTREDIIYNNAVLQAVSRIKEEFSTEENSKKSIKSNLRVLLSYLLVNAYLTEFENKSFWKSLIKSQFYELKDEFPNYECILFKNFYLQDLDLIDVYEDAKIDALDLTNAIVNINAFPQQCPWTKEQLVNSKFINDFIEKYCK